jgi:hypothetical protein
MALGYWDVEGLAATTFLGLGVEPEAYRHLEKVC